MRVMNEGNVCVCVCVCVVHFTTQSRVLWLPKQWGLAKTTNHDRFFIQHEPAAPLVERHVLVPHLITLAP